MLPSSVFGSSSDITTQYIDKSGGGVVVISKTMTRVGWHTCLQPGTQNGFESCLSYFPSFGFICSVLVHVLVFCLFTSSCVSSWLLTRPDCSHLCLVDLVYLCVLSLSSHASSVSSVVWFMFYFLLAFALSVMITICFCC